MNFYAVSIFEKDYGINPHIPGNLFSQKVSCPSELFEWGYVMFCINLARPAVLFVLNIFVFLFGYLPFPMLNFYSKKFVFKKNQAVDFCVTFFTLYYNVLFDFTVGQQSLNAACQIVFTLISIPLIFGSVRN